MFDWLSSCQVNELEKRVLVILAQLFTPNAHNPAGESLDRTVLLGEEPGFSAGADSEERGTCEWIGKSANPIIPQGKLGGLYQLWISRSLGFSSNVRHAGICLK